jgi:hypothetical protein
MGRVREASEHRLPPAILNCLRPVTMFSPNESLELRPVLGGPCGRVFSMSDRSMEFHELPYFVLGPGADIARTGLHPRIVAAGV